MHICYEISINTWWISFITADEISLLQIDRKTLSSFLFPNADLWITAAVRMGESMCRQGL